MKRVILEERLKSTEEKLEDASNKLSRSLKIIQLCFDMDGTKLLGKPDDEISEIPFACLRQTVQNSGPKRIIPQSGNDCQKAPGEKGITDKGYEGLDKLKFLILLKRQRVRKGQHKVALAADEREYNRRISSLRIEVERVNARLKNFGVLRMSRIRSKWLHCTIFSIICNVVNIQMELQPMRKSIHESILSVVTPFHQELNRRSNNKIQHLVFIKFAGLLVYRNSDSLKSCK